MAEANKTSFFGKVFEMVGLKTIVSIVIALLLLASSFWRIETDLAIQVKTGRIAFMVNPVGDQKQLTDSIFFEKLSLEHVGHLSFSPDQLLVANPDELDWESDTYPLKAWVELPGSGRTRQFHVAKAGSHSMVTLQSIEGKEAQAGKLDAIVLSQPSSVMLEATSDQTITLTIRTDREPQRLILSGLKKIELVEEGLQVEQSSNLPFSQDQELTYQALFDGTSGTMTVEATDTTFILVINFTESSKNRLFPKMVLPIISVDVSWQNPKTGERGIHPKFQGSVEYPTIPDLPKVKFKAPRSLTIEDLDRFEIISIRIDQIQQMFVIDMQGKAGYVKTGTRENPQDLRPTLFDLIRFHPVLKPLRRLIGV